MLDVKVKCDKPYDLDAADKRNGKPRRRRQDSKSTAYELTIRLTREQSDVLGGKAKFVRHVFARNKRDELAEQVAQFEAHVEGLLTRAAIGRGKAFGGKVGPTVSDVARAYFEAKRGSVTDGYLDRIIGMVERYVDPTIGRMPFAKVSYADAEAMIASIPEISRKNGESKRAALEAAREERDSLFERGLASKPHRKGELQEARVAGRNTQRTVLGFMKSVGRYAQRKGYVEKNVFDDDILRSRYPSSPPMLDNYSVEDAAYLYRCIQQLPLSAKKVQLHVAWITGMRPCEVRAVCFEDVDLADPEDGKLFVTKRHKTANARRCIPLDPGTTRLIAEWKEDRMRFAEEAGLRFSGSWHICTDDGHMISDAGSWARWASFLKDCGMDRRRPYSVRHTFATLNATNLDAVTLAALMGHAKPGFTYNVYAAYLPTAAKGVTTRYAAKLGGGVQP